MVVIAGMKVIRAASLSVENASVDIGRDPSPNLE